jgi:hypothetical protein
VKISAPSCFSGSKRARNQKDGAAVLFFISPPRTRSQRQRVSGLFDCVAISFNSHPHTSCYGLACPCYLNAHTMSGAPCSKINLCVLELLGPMLHDSIPAHPPPPPPSLCVIAAVTGVPCLLSLLCPTLCFSRTVSESSTHEVHLISCHCVTSKQPSSFPQILRSQLDIPGSLAEDILLNLACLPCATCQEARHVQSLNGP